MNRFHPHAVARRAAVASWIVSGVFGVMAIAFFKVQVLASDRYQLQSDENRLRAVPLPAPRGLITDRHGVVLAENVPGYSVALLASSPESLASTMERIAPIAGLDAEKVASTLDRYRRAPHDPVMIMRDAPFEVVSALEERRLAIRGLIVQAEPKRSYPYGSAAAHLVGYVAEINERELASRRYEGARPGLVVGRTGLEHQYDETIMGKDGVRFVEVDALGRTVRVDGVGARLDPQQGDTLKTTIDLDLQLYVARIYPRRRRGAVIVMDPRTGEVLALYSSPSHDPNAFVGGYEAVEWQRLTQLSGRPLFNRATQGRYPPASPWKLALAVMALKREFVQLDSKMPTPCRGGIQYGNRYFRCWRVEGHGDLTLTEAIQHSCDVYFYQLGLRLGLDNLLGDGAELGFGRRSGIDLPSEMAPIFPGSTEYYNRRYGPRGWTQAVTLNLAIGQGENDQTLINMVQFFAMLANEHGVAHAPYLVKSADGSEPVRSLDLSEEDLRGLRMSLVSVVEEGTATASRIANLRIAGKTGTAQNPHGPDHGWFIAFSPAEEPRVVVGALVEHAEHGSSVAPLVTRIIARHLLGPNAPGVEEGDYRLIVPSDSAPEPELILPEIVSPVGRRNGLDARTGIR